MEISLIVLQLILRNQYISTLIVLQYITQNDTSMYLKYIKEIIIL